MKRIDVVIHGCKGRMGTLLVSGLVEYPGMEFVGGIDLGVSNLEQVRAADVVVDFSSHNATIPLAEACVKSKTALVIGTTGHTTEELTVIREYAKKIPTVKAPNFSVGVAVLLRLARYAVEILGPDFDLEIVEAHHRMKKDAPSGTAKALFDVLAGVRQRQVDGETTPCFGRSGNIGPRSQHDIGVHSIRGGDVVGNHTVHLFGGGERLELTHMASSRQTFVRGALTAAMWVVNQPPGLYDMMDVLGLK